MQNFPKNIKSLCVALFLAIGGCASVMMGSYQDVFIETKCGDKPVKAECSVSNEIGEWSVKTPGTLHLHKGYDQLELNCKGDSFDLHKVKITSSGNLPLYGNALIGGGIGVFTDIETRAGFDYPTKITFIVNSCVPGEKLNSEEAKVRAQLKETEPETAKSYPVKRGSERVEGSAKQTQPTRNEFNKGEVKAENKIKSEPEKLVDKEVGEQQKREPTKPKPVPYCKQLDMAIPGCTLQ
jgi:hypothetical protein